jgi:hypothetical protein
MLKAKEIVKQIVEATRDDDEPDWKSMSPEEICDFAMEKYDNKYLAALHYVSVVAKDFERHDIRTYSKFMRAIRLVKQHRDD